MFAEAMISLGIFLLALIPRAYDLPRFVTADEAKWVYRSAQFLSALLNGDFPATNVNLTPAVTTTWLGGLGLAVHYYLNQAAINMPFDDWLASLPQFRTEVPILVAARWPVVITTSLAVVLTYLLARRLFQPGLALAAAILIAVDAHTIALSRILGHDALVTIFMSISLLLLLLTTGRQQTRERGSAGIQSGWGLLVLAGIATGLALLSKAPALFMIPFASLMLLWPVLINRTPLARALGQLFLWAGVVYLTFIVLWPAAWVDPIGQPWAVVENALLSATDRVEAAAEGYWLVPNLGPLYYLANGAFKLNPLVMVGVVLAIGFVILAGRSGKGASHSEPESERRPVSGQTVSGIRRTLSQPLVWLALFVILFGLFMTLGGKRSPRYILPAFPPLAIIAGYGWLKLYQAMKPRGDRASSLALGKPVNAPNARVGRLRLSILAARFVLPVFLLLLAAAILTPYVPYYFSYYNPLLGGAYTAPRLVKIGWGEGLDQVGLFLQRELTDSRVGTAYASTVAPFFKGDLSRVTGENLDYLVLYRKQVQSGEPSPAFVRYFEQLEPLFSVELNGIRYADVYSGPALQPALDLVPGPDGTGLPKPIGFRSLTPYGRIGQPLVVDVIWPSDQALPTEPATVTLASLDALDLSQADGEVEAVKKVQNTDQTRIERAQGQGQLTRVADDLIVSRHHLTLPEDLERGRYALLIDGRPLGEIEVRHFDLPGTLGEVRGVVFDRQIGLAGYRFRPTEDYISVTVAWQAEKARLPDYTVFAQFLNVETNERVAGIDTRPLAGAWPTSRWVQGEVVVDEYFVAVPPNLEPGFYKMIVGLYQPDTGQRLVRPNGQDHWALPFTFIWEK